MPRAFGARHLASPDKQKRVKERAIKLAIKAPTSSMLVETALRWARRTPIPQAALLEAKSFRMEAPTREAVAEASAKGAVAFRTFLDKEEVREEALHKGARQLTPAKPAKAKGRGVAVSLEQEGRARGEAAEELL
jgi:hypothetical protein